MPEPRKLATPLFLIVGGALLLLALCYMAAMLILWVLTLPPFLFLLILAFVAIVVAVNYS